MRLMRILFVFLLIAAGVPVFASEGSLEFGLTQVEMRGNGGMEEIWMVMVTDWTEFIPFHSPPGDFSIYDLQVDMPVFVEGIFCGQPLTITAHHVFFGFFPPPKMGGHDPMSDAIGGRITDIDYEGNLFHVAVDTPPPQPSLDIWMTDDTVMMEAFRYMPIMPIDFNALMIGDPIMVLGYEEYEWTADVLIRSDDWMPESQVYWGPEFQIYGFIEDIYSHGDRYGIRVGIIEAPAASQYEFEIGYSGGRCEFPWGYLDFPPGALNQWQRISVSGDFVFWWTLQNVYLFEPHGISFSQPVEIEIRYFNLEGIDPDRVNLSYYDEDLGKWRVAGHMDNYPDEHCFRGVIHHFSRYSLSTNGKPLYYLLGM
jgi:hypothetical protein